MLVGIDLTQRIEFTSKDDKTEPKTIFILKPLSARERMSMSNKDEILFDMVNTSVVEIRNCNDKTKEEYLESLPLDTLVEIGMKVNNISGITDDDKKN